MPGGAQESGILAAQLPQDGRKLIMNAELAVEALDFDKTLAALRVAADAAGGYLSSTYLEGGADSGARYAHCEFRIPVEQYDTFLTAADAAGNVTQKSESVQDVTAQYVDVEARLASLETQRESLNAMLAQAQDIKTLLAVQSELADVQYQIESYTAKKRAYDDQIAYSTVQVTVHEVCRVTESPQSFCLASWRGVPLWLVRPGPRRAEHGRGPCRHAARAAGAGCGGLCRMGGCAHVAAPQGQEAAHAGARPARAYGAAWRNRTENAGRAARRA